MSSRFVFSVMVAILSFVVLSCLSPVFSQVPEAIEKQLHSDKDLQILVIAGRNVNDIKKIKENPRCARIVVIQALPGEIDEDGFRILAEWVEKQGGTLWFYDSRLAPHFGMESSPISKEGIMNKEVEGEYGAMKKFPGIATLAHPVGEHPVLTGVTGVVVFVMKVGEDQYSAVKSGGKVQALLKTDLIKGAAVSALKEAGNGKIFLKPLLWEKQVDGARFQANIKEFSAGFEVPLITSELSKIPDKLLKENKETAKLKIIDFIYLSDGRSVWGKVLNESIRFETPDKTINIPVKQLDSLEIDAHAGLDRVQYGETKSLTGFLSLTGGLQFMTPSGTKVVLDKQDIKKVLFNKDKEAYDRGGVNATENSGGTR